MPTHNSSEPSAIVCSHGIGVEIVRFADDAALIRIVLAQGQDLHCGNGQALPGGRRIKDCKHYDLVVLERQQTVSPLRAAAQAVVEADAKAIRASQGKPQRVRGKSAVASAASA